VMVVLALASAAALPSWNLQGQIGQSSAVVQLVLNDDCKNTDISDIARLLSDADRRMFPGSIDHSLPPR
jgi:hypothetical protein